MPCDVINIKTTPKGKSMSEELKQRCKNEITKYKKLADDRYQKLHDYYIDKPQCEVDLKRYRELEDMFVEGVCEPWELCLSVIADLATAEADLTDADQIIAGLEGDIVLLQAKKDDLAKRVVQLCILRQVPKQKKCGKCGKKYDYLVCGLNFN